MRQIYINTMLGTQRIDYDPTLPGDVIISATNIGTITGINQVHIEETNIDPADIVEQHNAQQHYVVMPISNVQDKLIHAVNTTFEDGELF